MKPAGPAPRPGTSPPTAAGSGSRRARPCPAPRPPGPAPCRRSARPGRDTRGPRTRSGSRRRRRQRRRDREQQEVFVRIRRDRDHPVGQRLGVDLADQEGEVAPHLRRETEEGLDLGVGAERPASRSGKRSACAKPVQPYAPRKKPIVGRQRRADLLLEPAQVVLGRVAPAPGRAEPPAPEDSSVTRGAAPSPATRPSRRRRRGPPARRR